MRNTVRNCLYWGTWVAPAGTLINETLRHAQEIDYHVVLVLNEKFRLPPFFELETYFTGSTLLGEGFWSRFKSERRKYEASSLLTSPLCSLVTDTEYEYDYNVRIQVQKGGGTAGREKVTDLELASSLSYALVWHKSSDSLARLRISSKVHPYTLRVKHQGEPISRHGFCAPLTKSN